MDILLYIGAGSDVRPITDLPYTHFLYVDALPDKPHFTPEQYGYPFYKDKDAFVKTLETKLEEDLEVEGPLVLTPNIYMYTLDDDKTLTYAFNTWDKDAHLVPEVAALLPNVSAVFLTGYAPKFNGLLPALKTVYATPIVENMMYDDWTEQFCQGRDVEWLRVYDSDCSGNDVFEKNPNMSWTSDDSDCECSSPVYPDSDSEG
jgi:hypothetical protein